VSRVSVEQARAKCFSVNNVSTRYETAERILFDIHSALIREIRRSILYLFHSQNYQLHADSKGILIMVRDRMADLRAVSIFTFSVVIRNVSKKKEL